jgi:hypothetical protein
VVAVGAAELTKSLCPPAIDEIPVGHYVPLLEFNQGRIKRAARFGYLEIPRKMSLPQVLHFERYPTDGPVSCIVYRQEQRDLQSGTLIDPYG